MAHQMSCNHPFRQEDTTTERSVGVGDGGDSKGRGGGRGWTKFEKEGMAI